MRVGTPSYPADSLRAGGPSATAWVNMARLLAILRVLPSGQLIHRRRVVLRPLQYFIAVVVGAVSEIGGAIGELNQPDSATYVGGQALTSRASAGGAHQSPVPTGVQNETSPP